MILTLQQVKLQCRLMIADLETEQANPEDELLTLFIKAAIKVFENRTNRLLYSNDNKPDPLPDNALLATEDIQAALLTLIAHWYENRETVNIGNITSVVPLTFDFIIEPYRFISL